jgi:ribose-phosphate pyrophosphokinase
MTPGKTLHSLLYGNIRLFAGTASLDLAQEVADNLGLQLCGRDVIEFTNENLFVKLHASVRGQDCYIIQRPPCRFTAT